MADQFNASACCPAFFVLGGILFVLVILLWNRKYAQGRDRSLGETIQPFLQSIGMKKISDFNFLSGVDSWSGVYRKQNFTIKFNHYFSDVRRKGSGIFTESITLLISADAEGMPTIYFSSEDDMRKRGMGDIYLRLKKLGILDFFRMTAGSSDLIFVSDSRLFCYIPGSILKQESLKEALDIMCDILAAARNE
jgi:hypothetical protein